MYTLPYARKAGRSGGTCQAMPLLFPLGNGPLGAIAPCLCCVFPVRWAGDLFGAMGRKRCLSCQSAKASIRNVRLVILLP